MSIEPAAEAATTSTPVERAAALLRMHYGGWSTAEDWSYHLAEKLAEHKLLADPDGWEPGRWWRVREDTGELWCETSDEDEAREQAAAFPGRVLKRQYLREEREWRVEPVSAGDRSEDTGEEQR